MLYLSIGENCMAGKMLRRFEISNTWSTPYTWARSNISYAIECEEQKYNNLLNVNYIVKDDKSPFPESWRNTSFVNQQGPFEHSVSNGFEFAHHDVIDNAEHKSSYERKTQRMLELRDTDEDIVFFYHHRYVDNDNIDFVISECERFLQFYASDHHKRSLVIITQSIVSDYTMRRIEVTQEKSCVVARFYTTRVWAGSEEGMVAGELDDDLFVEMFKELKTLNVLDDIDFLKDYKCSPVYYLNDCNSLIEERIKKLLNDKIDNLYIWGSNGFGYALANYLLSRGIRVTAFIDDKPEKQGNTYKELPTLAYLKDIRNPNIILAIKKKKSMFKILNQIEVGANVITYEELFGDLIS